MRRLISSSRNLMLDCDPKIAKLSAFLDRFPSYSAPPQRTSRSCIGLAPLAQLALDFLEGNVGEVLSFLWRDATFEMRLREPTPRERLDDPRSFATVLLERFVESCVIIDGPQAPGRADVIGNFATEEIIEVACGQPREKLAGQHCKPIWRRQTPERQLHVVWGGRKQRRQLPSR